MRFLTGLCVWLLLASCSPEPKEQAIGLQVWGHFPEDELDFASRSAGHFFKRKIILLAPASFPSSFCNREKGIRYAADSIIRTGAVLAGDSLLCVVALTDADIYTDKRNGKGNTKEAEYKYRVWGIFGLGYQPGKACVISRHRLQTTDTNKFRHRLRTVMIHEIGHNLGLPHCPVAGCIMSDANERMATVDNSSNDYCPACRKRAGI